MNDADAPDVTSWRGSPMAASLAALLAVTVSASGQAVAQPEAIPSGSSAVEGWAAALGVRVSGGFPLGNIGRVNPTDQQPLALGDVATHAVLVGPELGIVGPSLRATVFGELGWLGSRAQALGCSDATPSGSPACGARLVRIGLQVERFFAPPEASRRPWLGAGAGYEWLSLHGPATNPLGVPTGRTIGGFELLRLSAGVDAGGPRARLGPFLGLSFGRYHSSEVARPEVHAWLLFGLRFTFASPFRTAQ